MLIVSISIMAIIVLFSGIWQSPNDWLINTDVLSVESKAAYINEHLAAMNFCFKNVVQYWLSYNM